MLLLCVLFHIQQEGHLFLKSLCSSLPWGVRWSEHGSPACRVDSDMVDYRESTTESERKEKATMENKGETDSHLVF